MSTPASFSFPPNLRHPHSDEGRGGGESRAALSKNRLCASAHPSIAAAPEPHDQEDNRYDWRID